VQNIVHPSDTDLTSTRRRLPTLLGLAAALGLLAGAAPASAQSTHDLWLEMRGSAVIDLLDHQARAALIGNPLVVNSYASMNPDFEDVAQVQWTVTNPRADFTTSLAFLEMGDEAPILELTGDLHLRVLNDGQTHTWEGTLQVPIAIDLEPGADGGPGQVLFRGDLTAEDAIVFEVDEVSFPVFYSTWGLVEFFDLALSGSTLSTDAGEADANHLTTLLTIGLALLESDLDLPDTSALGGTPGADWVVKLHPGAFDDPDLTIVRTTLAPEDLPDTPGPYWWSSDEPALLLHVPPERAQAGMQVAANAFTREMIQSGGMNQLLGPLAAAGIQFQVSEGQAVFVPGESVVEGVGTSWSGSIQPGFLLHRAGDDFSLAGTVAEVVDDDTLILESPWTGDASPAMGGGYLALRVPQVELFQHWGNAGVSITVFDSDFVLAQQPDPITDVSAQCDVEVPVDAWIGFDVVTQLDPVAEWIQGEAWAYPNYQVDDLSADCGWDIIQEALIDAYGPDLIAAQVSQAETDVYEMEIPLETTLQEQLNGIVDQFSGAGRLFSPAEFLLNEERGLYLVGTIVPIDGVAGSGDMGPFDCSDGCGGESLLFQRYSDDETGDLRLTVNGYWFPMLPSSSLGPAWERWTTFLGTGWSFQDVEALQSDGAMADFVPTGDFALQEDVDATVPGQLVPGEMVRVDEEIYVFQTVLQADHEFGSSEPRFVFKQAPVQQTPQPVQVWEQIALDYDWEPDQIGEFLGSVSSVYVGSGLGADYFGKYDVETYEMQAWVDSGEGVFGGALIETVWLWDGVVQPGPDFTIDSDGITEKTWHTLTVEQTWQFADGSTTTLSDSAAIQLPNVWHEYESSSDGPVITPAPDLGPARLPTPAMLDIGFMTRGMVDPLIILEGVDERIVMECPDRSCAAARTMVVAGQRLPVQAIGRTAIQVEIPASLLSRAPLGGRVELDDVLLLTSRGQVIDELPALLVGADLVDRSW